MIISEKIKAIKKKMEQNKAQYDLQTAKISALSSGKVSKYGFFTSKDFFPEKALLEKVAALRRFEYSPLGKELKTQTSAAEKQYQELNKIFKPDEKKEPATIKKENLEITNEPNLLYDSKYSFSECKNFIKFYDL